jgi:predicted HAD superfamily hydrolase
MEKDSESESACVMNSFLTVSSSMGMAIYSFDVFDTLVTRPFMRPTDIFYLVGQTLSVTNNVEINPNLYRRARIRAEHRARLASQPADDCKWEAIFRNFPELSRWGLSCEEAMQAELDAEQRSLRLIAENVTTVRRLIESGEHVIFLSDMYLPTNFVWKLICEHVSDCQQDQVYVSGDLGLSKHTGRLYLHVLERYRIAPEQLRHLGDNFHSDVEIPLRLGINAEHYRGIQPTHHERLPRPRRWTPLIRSAMHGTARAARLAANYSKRYSPVASIAASVVAPVLTAYVAWVLQDARRRGIERLYFVSRDGQILQLIASVLRRDGDPECRYLYGSRQAWFLPSVRDLDDESLKWAWMKGMSRSGHDILRRLEINEEPILSILAHQEFDKESLARQLDNNEFERIKALIRTEPIASILLKKAESRRMLLLEYLKQEGCFDGARWALVDIGWVLNCQQALNQVFINSNFPHAVTGYYFGISHDHVPLTQVGVAYPFIAHANSNFYGHIKADWLFKKSTRVIIEHLFVIADHKSVCGYHREAQHIAPLYVSEIGKELRMDFAKVIHSTVRAYVEILARTDTLDALTPDFRKRALEGMRKFCLYPRVGDVLPVADLAVNMDQTHGENHWKNLASRITLRELFLLLLEHFSLKEIQNKTPAFYWLEGSAAISSWPVRLVILSGGALSRTFNSLRTRLPDY